jgi:hypothetical protein
MTRTLADAAAILSVLEGRNERDPLPAVILARITRRPLGKGFAACALGSTGVTDD